MILSDHLKTASLSLNRKVQEAIDPKLFLFCNFEPTVSWFLSPDAQYLISIQDLYKFAVDSSCIIKCYRDFLDRSQWKNYDRLHGICDQINTLRAVVDHNQSDQNGWIEQNRLDGYTEWIRKTVGKEKPTEPKDFDLLNQKLFAIAKELIQLLEKFVDCVGRSCKKEEQVQLWINKTLRWYTSNTKTEIYKGQLINAYVANANRPTSRDLYDPKHINRKIRKWVEAALCYPFDKKLKELSDSIKNCHNALDEDSPMYQKIKEKVPEDKFNGLIQQFQRNLKQYEHDEILLKEELNALENMVYHNCWEYFFSNLENQLRSTMARLDADSTPYTLLPQDLLQEDIRIYFGCVPSPEGDF